MRRLGYIISLLLIIITIITCKKRQEYLNNNVTPNNFLSGAKYDKLIIEIDYVNGYEPEDATVQNIVSFLNSRINKPLGIEVTKQVIPSGSGSVYDLTDIRNIEKQNRSGITKGSTITAYILFLDKDFAANRGVQSKVLGINYEPSSIVIFENTIRQYSGEITQPPTELLETVVSEHELGHLLGLTNNGSPMQTFHQDTPNGTHCNNKNCLMYYNVETSDIIANLIGDNPPPVPDENCSNDLRANGGK